MKTEEVKVKLTETRIHASGQQPRGAVVSVSQKEAYRMARANQCTNEDGSEIVVPDDFEKEPAKVEKKAKADADGDADGKKSKAKGDGDKK